MWRRLTAEAIGSLLLCAAVIGSRVMAERLSAGDDAIALLANTFATVAVLAVLIGLFAPVSGAHFNPVVSLVQALRGTVQWHEAGVYVIAQTAGCLMGKICAHGMFGMPRLQWSQHARSGVGQCVGEALATFGLVLVVLGHRRVSDAPWMVAGWIGGAYWFTSSTAFANPAITLARSFSNTFAGIRPVDAPAFIIAQFVGAGLAFLIARFLFEREDSDSVQNAI